MTLAGDADYIARHGAYTGPGDLTQLLADASSLVRREARMHIGPPVENEEIVLDGDGSNWLFLPDIPVRAVAAVTADGTALVEDTDFEWARHGRLERVNACWPCKRRSVEVTYSHSDDVPDWIVNLVCAMVQRAARPGAAEQIQQRTTGSQTISYVSSAAGVVIWLTTSETGRLEGLKGPVL